MWKTKYSVAVACFLPDRAKDLSTPLYGLDYRLNDSGFWVFVSPDRQTFLFSISPGLALGLTQLPFQDTDVSFAEQSSHAVTLTTHHTLVLRLRMHGAVTLLPLTCFFALCMSSRGFVSNLAFPLSYFSTCFSVKIRCARLYSPSQLHLQSTAIVNVVLSTSSSLQRNIICYFCYCS
jgi:hypothetical protein